MSFHSCTRAAIRTLVWLGFNRWKHGLGVPDGHRGLARANTLLKRFLLLIRWVISLVFHFRRRQDALYGLKEIGLGQAAKLNRKCLVLGSGEIKHCDRPKLIEMAQDQSVAVMVMNHFNEGPLFGRVNVDYWLMLDTGAQQRKSNQKVSNTWGAILECVDCSVVIPWQDFKYTSHPRKIGMENHSLAGVTKNINPLWPRGYEGKSCLKAICLADYMGFSEIVVAGCNNDYFRSASVYDGNMKAEEVDEFSPMAAEDYFQNIANEFAYQRMVLSKIKSKVTFVF